MRKILIIVLILTAIGLGSDLALTAIANRPQQPTEIDFANLPPNITVAQDVSTVAYTREDMIDHAAVIFEGKVLSISPTFWNQDSGEYWYDETTGVGLQLHTIELEVLQPIVDTIGIEKQVTIYVLGASPLDSLAEGEDATVYQGGGDYEMKVGDQVIFFSRQRDLAWREGGTRKLLMSDDPAIDAFIQLSDGLYDDPWSEANPVSLEEVIAQIAARREDLVVP